MAKEIFVAFGIDVDAVGGWLGSYGGEKSPGDISRGVFAGIVEIAVDSDGDAWIGGQTQTVVEGVLNW